MPDATGSSSKKKAAPKVSEADAELARRLDAEINGDRADDQDTENHENAYSRGCPKEIKDAMAWVQKLNYQIMGTKCRKCNHTLLRDLEVSAWVEQWRSTQGSKHAMPACGAQCRNCSAITCIGCRRKPRVGNPQFMSEYEGLNLDWCCSRGAAFIALIVLCKYDKLVLNQQAYEAQNHAALQQHKGNRPSTGVGYTSNRIDIYSFGAMYAVDSRGVRQVGRAQALNFKQQDAETDGLTKWVLGVLIELLPKKQEVNKEIDPVLPSLFELSLLPDRAAELLRNDSLNNINQRYKLYFTLFELVNRLGHHEDLDYLVLEDRFKKQESAGLYAIANAGSGKSASRGKGKDIARTPLVVRSKREGMASPLILCMANLAKQSKILLEGGQNKAAGGDILEIAKRINKLYISLAPENGGLATITTWKEYHQASCLIRVPNVEKHLCNEMAKEAAKIHDSAKGRNPRLVTEASEMATSLPDGVFVMVDEVRPDILKVSSVETFMNLNLY